MIPGTSLTKAARLATKMPAARLIVCESTSKWAVALRRTAPPQIVSRIRETRTGRDCWAEATARPDSLVLREITFRNLEEVATELVRFGERLRQVPVVVAGDRSLAPAEWLLRELGAVHAVFSARALEPVVRILQRHFRERAAEESAEG